MMNELKYLDSLYLIWHLYMNPFGVTVQHISKTKFPNYMAQRSSGISFANLCIWIDVSRQIYDLVHAFFHTIPVCVWCNLQNSLRQSRRNHYSQSIGNGFITNIDYDQLRRNLWYLLYVSALKLKLLVCGLWFMCIWAD